MDRMIAYCGLDCYECGAYLATQKDDDAEREKVAERWRREYGADVKAQDINCDGCLLKSGRLYKSCLSCDVRNCGLEKNVENCAYCDDYPCQKLTGKAWFTPDSSARLTLDKIREGLQNQ